MLGSPPGPTRQILDCEVREGPTPQPWPARVDNHRILADHDRALVVHDQASLYVSHGDEVVISAPDDTTRLEYDYLVYAFASRLLLLQRRRFTLHATLVVSPAGDALAITGHSTAGKSTTSVELARRGWQLVCDDVVEVRMSGERVLAVPFLRPVHLSDEAARMLGTDPALGRELPGRDKRVYSIEADPAVRQLTAVVRVDLGAAAEVVAQVIPPLDALPVISMHSDPNGICELPEYRGEYLVWTGSIVSRLPVLDVRRPASGDSVSAVADAIERLVSQP